MRKFAICAGAFLLVLSSCQKPAMQHDEPQAITHRSCAADEVLQQQLKEDPARAERMQTIEAFTRKAIASGEIYSRGGKTLEILVVVHVLYNAAHENISDAQVQSQLDVLNKDFNSKNADLSLLPAGSFQNVVAPGFNIKFVLSQPPIHKYTKQKSFTWNDNVKYSKRGGNDAIDPQHKLNIWVCNLGQGLLGYAQFPGGNPLTDGVVCLYAAFGSRALYPSGTYISDYDLGRTTTHEVGHWLNLYHIWGDDGGSCSGTDLVMDTPNQADQNYGCPGFPAVSCNNGPNGDMFMNYMDYTDDACMYMFTQGQQARSLALFAAGGARAAFAN